MAEAEGGKRAGRPEDGNFEKLLRELVDLKAYRFRSCGRFQEPDQWGWGGGAEAVAYLGGGDADPVVGAVEPGDGGRRPGGGLGESGDRGVQEEGSGGLIDG